MSIILINRKSYCACNYKKKDKELKKQKKNNLVVFSQGGGENKGFLGIGIGNKKSEKESTQGEGSSPNKEKQPAGKTTGTSDTFKTTVSTGVSRPKVSFQGKIFDI